MPRILIVDDEPNICEAIGEFLRNDGHDVMTAPDGADALAALTAQHFDVVVTDIIMPRFSGIELLHRIKDSDPEVQVIVVTGEPTLETASTAFREHAFDYLPKPVSGKVLRQAVANACKLKALGEEKKRLEAENDKYREELEKLVEARTGEVLRANQRLQESLICLRENLDDSTRAMSIMIEKRDPYTAGHQARVAQLALAMATAMNLGENEIASVHTAALLHDVGKICVPVEILSKPAKLNDAEITLIQCHCEASFEILRTIRFPGPIATIAGQHHERWNGSGYPAGLPGKEVLHEARIIAVADVVEAMTHHRPFRPAQGVAAALSHITEAAGVLYDPDVTAACVDTFRAGFSFNGGSADMPGRYGADLSCRNN
jgi:putative nucleotidyltransferase with HDIG domain